MPNNIVNPFQEWEKREKERFAFAGRVLEIANEPHGFFGLDTKAKETVKVVSEYSDTIRGFDADGNCLKAVFLCRKTPSFIGGEFSLFYNEVEQLRIFERFGNNKLHGAIFCLNDTSRNVEITIRDPQPEVFHSTSKEYEVEFKLLGKTVTGLIYQDMKQVPLLEEIDKIKKASKIVPLQIDGLNHAFLEELVTALLRWDDRIFREQLEPGPTIERARDAWMSFFCGILTDILGGTVGMPWLSWVYGALDVAILNY